MCPRAIASEEEPYSAPFPLSYTFRVGTSFRTTTLQPPSPESSSIAIESTKGLQPAGMITLNYKCESSVVHLPDGNSMILSIDGMSASFDHTGFMGDMVVGQHIHFSAGDGID